MNKESTTALNPLFVVDTAPFLHTRTSVASISAQTFVALVPAVSLAIMTYGITALRVVCLAMGAAMLTEFICAKLMKQPIRLNDGTALISGLLFAFLLPPTAPWWLVVAGSVIALTIGKNVFGGLGGNPVCTPLVGWAIVSLSWPDKMNANAMILDSTFIEPLLQLKFFGPDSLPSDMFLPLLFGKQLGGLGTVYIAALILGGLYLIVRKAIRYEAVIGYFLAVLALGSLYWIIDPTTYISPELYFLTGSTVFAGFFLVTDHTTTPVSSLGLLLFGCFAGCLTIVIRIYSAYPDGALFGVMLANLITPHIDSIRSTPWGKRR